MKTALKMQDEMLTALMKQNDLLKKNLAEEEGRCSKKELTIKEMVDLINTLKDSIQLEQEIHHFKRDLALKTTEIQVIDEH